MRSIGTTAGLLRLLTLLAAGLLAISAPAETSTVVAVSASTDSAPAAVSAEPNAPDEGLMDALYADPPATNPPAVDAAPVGDDPLDALYAPPSTNAAVAGRPEDPNCRHAPPAFDFTVYQFPVNRVSTPVAYAMRIADVVLLVVLMSLGVWVVSRRRSRGWLWAALIVAAAWFGFVRNGCICPIGAMGNVTAGLVQTLTPETPPAAGSWWAPLVPPRAETPPPINTLVVLIFFLPLFFALFFGRVFCGAACPMGAVQDLLGPAARRRKWRIPRRVERALRVGRWLFFGAAVYSAAYMLGLPICRFDPFVTLFRLDGTLVMWLFTVTFLLLCILISRPYCRWLCPYSVPLSLLARAAPRRREILPDSCSACKRCERFCPVNCIHDNRVEPGHCVECGRCSHVCRNDAVR